jgi:hypothetical protein
MRTSHQYWGVLKFICCSQSLGDGYNPDLDPYSPDTDPKKKEKKNLRIPNTVPEDSKTPYLFKRKKARIGR